MIDITNIRFKLITEPEEGKEYILAECSIEIDGAIVIHGLRVCKDPECRLYVLFPVRYKDGTKQNIVHPTNSEAREYISNAIVEEYKSRVGRFSFADNV